MLAPLTGVGTDMSVNRPLQVKGVDSAQRFNSSGGSSSLSLAEQRQLRKENAPAMHEMDTLARRPGARFARDFLMTTDP